MDTLRAGQNFLAAHKHVVRVGVLGVGRVRHGVEGSHRQRELVQDVEIGVVLGLHQSAEQLLAGRRQILFVVHGDAGLAQHRDGLGKLQLERGFEEFKRFHVVLLTDGGDFAGVAEARKLQG